MSSEAAVRVGRNTVALLGGEVTGRFLGAAWAILLARHLGTEVFGEFSYTVAVVGILGVLSDFGLSTLVTREVARGWESPWPILKRALRARAALAALLSLLALGLTALTGGTVRALTLLAILSAAWLVIGQGDLLTAAHRGREQMEWPALASVLSRTFLFLAGVAAAIFKAPVEVFAALVLVAAIPVPLVLVKGLGARTPARGGTVEIVKRALPLGLGMVLWTFYFRIDLLLIDWLLGSRAVGLYAAPYRMVEAVLLLSGPFLAAVFPVLAGREPDPERQKRALVETGRILALCLAPLAALLLAEAPNLLHALFGPEYEKARGPLYLLALTIPASVIAAPLLTSMVAEGSERTWVRIMAAGAVVNPLLALGLIPALGIGGAALATLVTEAMVAALALRFRGVEVFTAQLRALAAGLILAGALAVLARLGMSLSARAAAGLLVVYPVAAFGLGAVSLAEARSLLAILGIERRPSDGE